MPLRGLLKSSNGELKAEIQLILNSVVEGLCGLDAEGNVIFCNEALLRMTGYPADEMIGRNLRQLLHYGRPVGTGPPARECALYNAIKARQEIHIEGELLWRKDQTCFPAEYSIHPFQQHSSRTAFVVTFLDLSEIQTDRDALRQSEERFRRILTSIPDVAWTSDRHGRTVYISPKVDGLFGYTKEEICAEGAVPWRDRIHPEDCGRAAQAYAALFEEQRAFDQEYRIRRKDGAWIWIYDRATRTYEQNGVLYADGVLSDVTQRKRAEKELRLAQSSLENASDGLFWVDPQARIMYANEAACQSLGRSREEVLSLSVPDIDPLVPREAWPALWENIKAQGSVVFESQNQNKQGSIFPVEVTANYMEFDGQEYIFAFVRDITERRALESQLRQAQKLESVGQLAAGIAHEINTPTQYIGDNTRFLKDAFQDLACARASYERLLAAAKDNTLSPKIVQEVIDALARTDAAYLFEEIPKAIEQTLEGVGRVSELVGAMKEFSHPGTKEKVALDLNHAIDNTITVARNEWKYVANIETDFDFSLPRISCQPGEFNQVILNLIVNAAHAIADVVGGSAKGTITVQTRNCPEWVEIRIQDTGSGIPEKVRARIFDPFFTTKEIGKGTGQGLAIARSVVVDKQGGSIHFQTEEGKGTTFVIRLPHDGETLAARATSA